MLAPPPPRPPRWAEEQVAAMHRDGYLIVRRAVAPQLVAAAKHALDSGCGGDAPEVMALLYESSLAPFLRAGLRGGDFHPVTGAQ
eukprot:SAG31_NODE_34485_length_332_cov_1.090129_1_plen_84_part_10